MGLFEWIGEHYNPGPTGSIDFNGNKQPQGPPPHINLRFLVAAGLFSAVQYGFAKAGYLADFSQLFLAEGCLAAYLLMAYFIRVRPNFDNTGWVPFLINHPFRISDNLNRLLVFLWVIFAPGKFVAQAIVHFYQHRLR
ncbi:MAG: hypothetical protein H6555_09595 [Lewinellaceae bacterium]|nr:hypothetical protein [Lewinellaceae bacterium]